MLQIDVANSQEKFSSHLRITQSPNRVLKSGIEKYAREEDLVDVIEWRWHVTTNASQRATQNQSNTAESFAAALAAAKSELARQYQEAGIPAEELAHADHLG